MAQSAILGETAFELDGDLRELERLVERVDQFCRAEGLDGEAAFELNLALEELFVNAVLHGGCGGTRGAATVRMWPIADGSVGVEFRDRGAPFNPATAAEPDLTAPLEDRKPGGLGIHLVRRIMSDLEYRRDGEWNQLTMRRAGKHEAESI
jgi:serine/threonine-protein kinase RsbW